MNTNSSGERLLYPGLVQPYETPSFRTPQFSPDKRHVYFVKDLSDTAGALWKLDVDTGQAAVMVPDAANFGVIARGPDRGFLIATQRSLSEPDDKGKRFPVYPFFLYTSEGKKIEKIGEDDDYLERLLEAYERE
jgi:hypothetical protein